ncbi:HEAT repeat domain-containing protein [Dyadobacter sp. CY312]|uniref:HEAT repeat domain-containing protein n=1 Tax=Dyadobacter sp. CY312 TaxID=2907303 RepID=UPI001F2A25EF|nr:HEAT repeat domain-containing protein [Dyadobacter sp. CY312]MCE7040418.1 HEAT repeat domain-containing protein [Dyadobacter sp. CY312]
MNQDIEVLLEKYYDGDTTLEEEKVLKSFFQNENVPAHLQSHAAQFRYYVESAHEQPTITFDERLNLILNPAPEKPIKKLTSWFMRIAAGLALVLVGFGGGALYNKLQNNSVADVAEIDVAPIQEIKTVLAFEHTQSTSASERIQAVNQSYTLSKADQDITQLLVNTLNFDPNVNVRLASCQALLRFKDEQGVTESLIQSLGIQTDPILQITLIETLVAIKEKRAVDQIQQLAKDQQILEAVRTKAQEGAHKLSQETSPSV